MSRRYVASVEDDDDPPMVDPSALFPGSAGPSSSSALTNPQDIFSHMASSSQSLPTAAQQQRMFQTASAQIESNVHQRYNPRGTGLSSFRPGTEQRDIDTSDWIRIYPVYFDATRSRAEGRRVHKDAAVDSPLASVIGEAVMGLGLPVRMHVSNTHPKDWANPGMVMTKVPEGGKIKNKHHLFILISQYLKANPTTRSSSIEFAQMAGMPFDSSTKPEAAGVPRGWKIGKVLPLHSPAVGEGMNEEMVKEMMAGMANMARGAASGGAPGGAGGFPDLSALAGGMPGLEGLASMFGGGAGGGVMPSFPGLGGMGFPGLGGSGGPSSTAGPSKTVKKVVRRK